MAAFGISFPKLTFCRSLTSKVDTNTVSTTTSTPTSTPTPPAPAPTAHRTFSLSIKSIPSQPLHYDVSTTTQKKKTSSITTILAIDGETKQLPKNLSVFNELQLDDEPADINEKIRRRDNSNDIIIPTSLPPMGTIDHRPDIRFLDNVDPKKILHDSKDEEKQVIQDRQSNHTFTPPTSSLSNNSLSNDLNLSSSSMSVDLPQLKYAIEKFLNDDDDPIYQIAEEFSTGCSLFRQENEGNADTSNVTTSDLKHRQVDNTERHPTILQKSTNDEVPSCPSSVSNNIKWYVSELRINRPLIYCTKLTYGQQNGSNRKLSHSVNDLKQFYHLINHQENGKYKILTKKKDHSVYSTLSLQSLKNSKQIRHQSDENIFRNNHLSSTDDDLNDEDNQNQLVSNNPRILSQSVNKADTLIRNESVKKKLFDILNDDELENACLEDMSQEFEKISLNDHRDLPIINSCSSSDDDDAIYSSPPNELQLAVLAPPLPLSSSYNENLSTNINNTTERILGRSRLITTSLDKIPMDNNNIYDYPSTEHSRPSWYTNSSPQWRMDGQQSMTSVLKKHDDDDDDINVIDPNRLLRTKVSQYDIKENKYIQKYNNPHHHRKEQKHISYSLVNSSTPLVDDSTPILPIIQDKSSNLLMFI